MLSAEQKRGSLQKQNWSSPRSRGRGRSGLAGSDPLHGLQHAQYLSHRHLGIVTNQTGSGGETGAPVAEQRQVAGPPGPSSEELQRLVAAVARRKLKETRKSPKEGV